MNCYLGKIRIDDVFLFLFSQVKFKSLALVTTASIAMEASGPMFLREEKSVRHVSTAGADTIACETEPI